jgi:hypothetical protein
MKKKLGRPTDYKPEYDERAFNLALLGLNDVQMAAAFDTSEKTFNEWKKQHPSFLQSLTRGKEDADAKVARSMYERALGVTIVEEAVTKDGDIVKLRKQLPSDTAAAKHWLANRQRGRWSNNGESTITTTEPLVIIRTEIKDNNNE